MTELISKLKSLGLTEYEAKAYIALLDRAELTAEEVSSYSKVPLPRVYGILELLAEKGFVKILPGRPRRFEAIAPKKAFEQYVKYRESILSEELKRMKEIFSEMEGELEEIYWRNRLRIKPEELLEPLADLYEMEVRTMEIISMAREEVLIFTELFSWFPKVEREIRDAIKRGVKVRVLMCTSTPEARRRAERLVRMGAEVKVAPEKWYPTRGVIADRSKLIFLIWAAEEEEHYWRPVLYRPHYTENRGLICVFLDAFEKRWASGEKFTLH
ncbi:MAG: hypothetical protein NDF55_03745 [archaeon GB-1867-005]|nr:hypothetical protein [Candidatus Culexmicrobium cathedralense]